MAKKEEINESTPIPNIGEKQGSWYFPLILIFTTLCTAAIVLLISAVIDVLQLSTGPTTLLVIIIAAILALYVISDIIIFTEWSKNTKAITDQEIAKSQILFLEAYKKARELKPGQALYDTKEWLHDLTTTLRKNKPEKQTEKNKQ